MTHICVSKLTIIGSDNGLSPNRRQAIIWTNAGLLLIGPLGTNLSEILIEIVTFSENAFEGVVCETAAILSRPQWVKLNFLNEYCSIAVVFQLKSVSCGGYGWWEVVIGLDNILLSKRLNDII